MEKLPRISIVTPTFNRSQTLPRAFESLLSQTFKDFEWIIVDDGSTDDTKRIVESFLSTATFPIFYFYKENGGVHTARNLGNSKARGKYLYNLDSDDTIVSNALETGFQIWESIPNPDVYWAVNARCVDSDGNTIGKLLPDDINQLPLRKQKKLLKKADAVERCVIVRTDILKKYPVPEFEGVKFIPESIVHRAIGCDYHTFYTNSVLRVYYQDQDNQLTRSKLDWDKLYPAFLYYMHLLNVIMKKEKGNTFLDRLNTIIKLAYTALRCGIPLQATTKKLDSIYDKYALILCWPTLFIYSKIKMTFRSALKQ